MKAASKSENIFFIFSSTLCLVGFVDVWICNFLAKKIGDWKICLIVLVLEVKSGFNENFAGKTS